MLMKLSLVILVIVGTLLVPARGAAAREARLACVGYDEDLGEYGTYLFRLRERPRTCTEYIARRVDHADELWLVQARWRKWGHRRTRATAKSRYCGMGSCTNTPAQLEASGLYDRCGVFTYTRLRVAIPKYHYERTLHLHACGGGILS